MTPKAMFKRLMLAKMPVLIAQDRLSRADGCIKGNAVAFWLLLGYKVKHVLVPLR
ncbi:MAG: hypothetical protein ACKOEU_06410 [Limnohabitans sp.]